MKLRIESSSNATVEKVRQMLRYTRAAMTPYVVQARVRVDECTDALENPLVRCRIQLRQFDGSLATVDELQPTMELAVKRAFERGLRTVRRKQLFRKRVA
jgi:hypothetical protein